MQKFLLFLFPLLAAQANGNKIVNTLAFVLLIVLAVGMFNVFSSGSCDEACQESRFLTMIDLGPHNKFGSHFYNKLESLNIENNENMEVKVKEVFYDSIIKVTIIDRMALDYNIECKELKLNGILKNKEFCQVGIIELMNGHIGYIIGSCEYDLMGFTKSHDKFGFYLKDGTQTLLPEDTLIIEYSSSGREKYSITPKIHRIFEVNCMN